MKLATFIAPGETAAQAGEVRGDEIVAFTTGTILERLAVRRPHTRRRPVLRPDGRPAPRAGPAPAGDLLHRPQLRRPHRRARLREAREAARLPQAAALERRRPAARSSARRPRQALDYEVELVLVMGAGQHDRRLRGRQRRLRPRPPALRGAVVTRQGLRHLLPVGPVDHDRRRDRPERPAPHHPRQRRAAPGRQHERPDLQAPGARRLHRRGLHARARRDHPHRHAERRRRGVQAAEVPAAGRHRPGGGRGPGGPRAPDHR